MGQKCSEPVNNRWDIALLVISLPAPATVFSLTRHIPADGICWSPVLSHFLSFADSAVKNKCGRAARIRVLLLLVPPALEDVPSDVSLEQSAPHWAWGRGFGAARMSDLPAIVLQGNGDLQRLIWHF